MGLIEFIIFCLIVCAIGWIGVWLLGYFVPGHPAIVDKIIWGLVIIMIILKLVQATGLMSYDPQIPRIR